LQLYREVKFSNQRPLLQINAYYVDSTTLADGTYELILEPEQGISEDQLNVAEELTEAPNQSSEIFDIPDPIPTQEGKPRYKPLFLLHCNLYIHVYLLVHLSFQELC
jgi:hypothetical protein